MKKRKLYFLCAFFLFCTTSLLLITGSSLLTLSLNNSNTVPLGTFITWFGIIALPLTLYFGINEFENPSTKMTKMLVNLTKASITLAVLWIVISYILAGNISFTFSETNNFQGGQLAMKLFWINTYGTIIIPILILITYWVSKLFFKFNK